MVELRRLEAAQTSLTEVWFKARTINRCSLSECLTHDGGGTETGRASSRIASMKRSVGRIRRGESVTNGVLEKVVVGVCIFEFAEPEMLPTTSLT